MSVWIVPLILSSGVSAIRPRIWRCSIEPTFWPHGYILKVHWHTSAQQATSVTKNVFRMKTNACRDGTLKNQPNNMGTTPQHIFSHHPYIVCHFANYALCLLVVCIRGWKAVGRVVLGVWCMLICAWKVCYGGCNVVAVEHGRYSLSCMQKLWAVKGLYGAP